MFADFIAQKPGLLITTQQVINFLTPKVHKFSAFVAQLGLWTSLSLVILQYQLNFQNPVSTTFLIIFNSLILHSHFNSLHQSSHHQLFKNPSLNWLLGNYLAFFCGLTFADFTSTHLQHHKYVNNPDKDPDHLISYNMGSGINFLFTPFKIFYHDFWFLRGELTAQTNLISIFQNQRLASYFLTRFLQIMLVSTLFLFGFGNLWLLYWAIPMYIVGFFNGLFLFYLPHYQLSDDKKWLKNLGVFSKFFLFCAKIARTSHHKHHQKVNYVLAYYPTLDWLYSLF
jgi:beta-carotene hydroxylase